LTTLAKAKAKTNETFIVQASLMIFTYDRKNMFIVQATVHQHHQLQQQKKTALKLITFVTFIVTD
jgi:hypothetical protein